ncbi:MAG: DUF3152 domain-containing protein [Actinomycetota bacterium]
MRRARWSLLALALGLVLAACAPFAGSDPARTATAADGTTTSGGDVATGTAPGQSPEAAAPGSTTDTSNTTSLADGTNSDTSGNDDDADAPASTADGIASDTQATGTEATGAGPGEADDAEAPVVGEEIVIRLRLDRRVSDQATDGFDALVRAVLVDERGWTRAGFRFVFDDTDFDYTVVLAEGPDVDALCLPYDTFGRFSCQIGPAVALNADRWRTAVDSWPASLDEYRTMLVNHEVGHLLGQHHPADRCPAAGEPAPVMAQQSSGVEPCRANPWPLPWEITCAAQGVEPLAPPYERDIVLTCGPQGPVAAADDG